MTRQALGLGAALLVLASAALVLAERLQPTEETPVSPSSYGDYVGLYDYGGAILTVTRDGDRLRRT